ncbi:MAG: inositol monophosphatase [Candidatus Levybacteria bacterium]|nr:inositol monophosphatase [Candidatus Levybacteria bacterium]
MKIEAIREGVLRAGEAVRKARPTEGVITKDEGRLNFVTAADLESERILKEAIQKAFPGHLILSEETESPIEDILAIEHLWVIDPIDGTSNFRYEREYFGISVGYVEKGEPKIGFIYDPSRDQLFWAEKGKGAFLNGKPVLVGDKIELAKATVLTDNSYDPDGTRSNLEMLLKLCPIPWILVRGSAVLAYCDVAAGRADVFAHQFLKPWDNAAGFVIATEAGAVIKGLRGEEIDFTSPRAVVGNEALVNQFVNAINS